MAVAIAIWSLDLAPGKEEVVVPQADVRISNASLGEKLADQNGRTVVKVTYNKLGGADSDEEEEQEEEPTSSFILCALTAGKIENAQVNLVLEEGTEYKFELVGKNAISLSGNYIDQVGPDQPPFDEEDEFDSDEEDAYDLREVSSDVEMDPEELDGIESDASRFEEVAEEETAKPSKRPRESDAAEKEEKSAKSEKKNKKLKKESGEAVPVGKEEAKAKPEEKKEKKKEKKEKKQEDKATKEIKELSGGLKVQDHTVGTGPQAKKGDKLQMRYVGKLQNGKIFDKNTKGQPFSFRLGAGWDEGLVGMQVGGERKLVIPPKLGYGKRGAGPDIPPNATLTFEVKLLAIN